MTDEQRNGDAPMSIDKRIEWAREIIARKEDEAKTSDSFALRLSLSSMRQHLAEMEAQVSERYARIRAAMGNNPTFIPIREDNP